MTFFDAGKMSIKISVLSLMLCLAGSGAFALEPDEILVIANGRNSASLQIAGYYCEKRAVTCDNILNLSLPDPPRDNISRADYEKFIASPIRKKISEPQFAGKIKCLLTIYGIPFKINAAGQIKGQNEILKRLQGMIEQKTALLEDITAELQLLGPAQPLPSQQSFSHKPVEQTLVTIGQIVKNTHSRMEAMTDKDQQLRHLKKFIKLYAKLYGKTRAAQMEKKASLPPTIGSDEKPLLEKNTKLIRRAKTEKWDCSRKLNDGFYKSMEDAMGLNALLLTLNEDISRIKGTNTHASVDSELSMVMFDDYDLYRWQPNELKRKIFWTNVKTLMVSRLDGPGQVIATGLIDKAIKAEQVGLKGIAYIDSGKTGQGAYAEYDESLRQTARMIREKGTMKVVEEQTLALFKPGTCPETALYCGWYSLKKYVNAFDFVDGAVGFHISSLEAVNLRSPVSTQWCPAMLTDGITATLGAVAEPYLSAFPEPRQFFAELIKGKCLAEAFYRTNPYNSWQMVLIGDPLYRPFKR